MKQIQFSFDDAKLPSDAHNELQGRLQDEVHRIKQAWGAGYDTNYASLSCPSDPELLRRVEALANEKKKLNPRLLIIIGIGGSNLGALAIQEAIGHSDIPVAYADTVDGPAIAKIYAQAEEIVKAGHEVVIVVISKSGSTTETIANAQIFSALLQRYGKEQGIVVISDEGSALTKIAEKHGLSHLLIPEKVGGRYSVFSAVGLFPLAMMGIDIRALLKGAESMKAACTQTVLQENPAALSAATLYHFYHKGMFIHDTFAFSLALRGIADWYRQLMAESIGKAENNQGQKVHVGITPTSSIGSIDLHSVAQLYLAGPNNRTTTFLKVAEQKDMEIPEGTLFDSLVPMIEGKTCNTIMDAIVRGTQKAYQHAQRPYMQVEMPEISAYHCGQFLQMKMVEIMYLGYLFDINPFNQPQVELYKKETRKILSHE